MINSAVLLCTKTLFCNETDMDAKQSVCRALRVMCRVSLHASANVGKISEVRPGDIQAGRKRPTKTKIKREAPQIRPVPLTPCHSPSSFVPKFSASATEKTESVLEYRILQKQKAF